MRTPRPLLPALAIVLALGCGDDDDDVSGPDPIRLSLDEAWPSADGTAWVYDAVSDTWGPPEIASYESLDDVPPLPDLLEVARLLDEHPPGTGGVTAPGRYELAFDGTTTTDSGAEGQRLVELRYVDGFDATGNRMATVEDAFLRHLAWVRPDLRDRISARVGDLDPDDIPRLDPRFVHGGAFERTDAYVGTYGDLDLLLAWKFLEAPVTPGHTFVHQLVPELDDDVFLHARVADASRVTLPDGRSVDAVDVHYLIDFGISVVLTPGETEDPYYALVDYGRVTYARGYGPVASYERQLVDRWVTGELPDPGYGQVRLTLEGTSLGEGADLDRRVHGAVALNWVERDEAGGLIAVQVADSLDGVRVLLERNGTRVRELRTVDGRFEASYLDPATYRAELWIDHTHRPGTSPRTLHADDAELDMGLVTVVQRLLTIYPNPVLDTATIRFALAEDAPVTIRAVEVVGDPLPDRQLLMKGALASGEHSLQWTLPAGSTSPWLIVLERGDDVGMAVAMPTTR